MDAKRRGCGRTEYPQSNQSKIKFINVVVREEKRLAKQNIVALDLDRTEPPGCQASAWLQRRP